MSLTKKNESHEITFTAPLNRRCKIYYFKGDVSNISFLEKKDLSATVANKNESKPNNGKH